MNQATTQNLESSTVLCFSLGSEQFAIPLLSVKEVIALPEITPVPQASPHFVGIMNLRGQVISVMDLRAKFSIKPNPKSETAIIICDLDPNSIGIVVDSINSVLSPKNNEISNRPEIQTQKNIDSITGVFRSQDKLILLLDIEKTLSSADHQTLVRNQTQVTKKTAA